MHETYVPFPAERIEELREHIREQRRLQQQHENEYEKLLAQLVDKGVEIPRVREILGIPGIYCMEHDRNFNGGITRYDGDGLFPEINARYRAFTKQMRKVRTIFNNVSSVMDKCLQDYLPDAENIKAAQYISPFQETAIDHYEKSLFYGMFRPLLELEYMDVKHKRSDASRMSLFDYIVSSDLVNPAAFLRTKPLSSRSKLWGRCIKDLDEILRPPLPSKEQSAEMIAALLFHRFPTVFTDQEKTRVKAVRTIRR